MSTPSDLLGGQQQEMAQRQLAETTEHLRRLAETTDTLASAMDIGWTLFAATLVFFMHAGFAMLETGVVANVKNTQAVLLKNLINICVGALGWMLLGYGLAFGTDSFDEDGTKEKGGFIGTDHFAVHEYNLKMNDLFDDWFFQFTFCATSATIVSGAVAERVKLEGFVIFVFVMSLFIYPVVVHWTWGGGFLGKKGYTDFAGSGVVHLTGGVAALVGAIVLGPRQGRFDEQGNNKKFCPNNIGNICLGTLILWFGWYGFNAGSTTALSGGGAVTSSRCCVTTTVSGAMGGITSFAIASARQKKFDFSAFCNGILGGLVSITAGCASINVPYALLIGAIGGALVDGSSLLLVNFGIDDVVGAFPVHGVCGIWGVIAVGCADLEKGFFYGYLFDDCLGPNLVGLTCIIAWTAFTSFPIFFVLAKMNLLRLDPETELKGLDSEFVMPSQTWTRSGAGSKRGSMIMFGHQQKQEVPVEPAYDANGYEEQHEEHAEQDASWQGSHMEL